MKLALGIVALALSLKTALAAVPLWGQCNGIAWTGETVCVDGAVCTYVYDFYSQCLPAVAESTTTKTTGTTPPGPTVVTTTTPTATPSPAFVRTSGQEFTLDGKKFSVVGANAYWVGLSGLATNQLAESFSYIGSAGATVVRTWGFHEVTTIPFNAYYQIWQGKTPTVNTFADGIGSFDNVVAAAKGKGLKLIVVLTNNWSDFGGMDVYVRQMLGSENHDLFYTDASVKAAFKAYIKAFIYRYIDDPTIMAWELGNEPRCTGSTGKTSGNCNAATITAWITEIASYIKTIDRNHLVGIGDEGFFSHGNGPSYPYQSLEGIDFETNLAIKNIDFGTFHSYPGEWGVSGDDNGLSWGRKWIMDHIVIQKKLNKPVILEEYGATGNQLLVYDAWMSTVTSGLTGDLIWQAGSSFNRGGDTRHSAVYDVYPGTDVYDLLRTHSNAIKARPRMS